MSAPQAIGLPVLIIMSFFAYRAIKWLLSWRVYFPLVAELVERGASKRVLVSGQALAKSVEIEVEYKDFQVLSGGLATVNRENLDHLARRCAQRCGYRTGRVVLYTTVALFYFED